MRNHLPLRRASLLVGAVAAALLLAGCGINVRKDENGQDKKVDISSPFGSLHVNTDVDLKTLGLPVYPGAQQRRDVDRDKHSANVNIDSSLFGLKVVAAEFESDDAQDKVLDYYRKALKSYGNVLECQGRDRTQHARPGESKELSCGGDDDSRHGASISMLKDHSDATELKVGTTDRQHIVAVRSEGGKTRFGLVYVQTRGSHDSI